jgi:hypothetical protein
MFRHAQRSRRSSKGHSPARHGILRGRARAHRPPAFGPRLEVLEDRTVLSFFSEPVSPLGIPASAQALGDFNSDGKPDLIVVSQLSSTANVLLGNRDGTFTLRSQNPTGSGSDGVAVGECACNCIESAG